MPGRLFLTRPMAEVAAWLAGAGPVPSDAVSNDPVPNDPPRYNIAPGQQVICRTAGGLEHARWGMIPVGRVNARGRPVMETIVNARSETVFDKTAFAGVARAVVPADGWYEWTGKVRSKTAWRIARKDVGLMGFAAIHDVWSAPGGAEVAQVATVTCPPNGDVRDIHDRMGVILAAEQLDVWLHGSAEEAAELMRPLPDGTLCVVKADAVDWSGA